VKTPSVCTIDFETLPIRRRPEYPPKPVSVSIMLPNEKKPRWYAWGHPTKNNCTYAQAMKALRDVWTKYELLFHNGKFDYDVATTHMGMKALPWEKLHDTLFLVFLENPYEQLGLKPSAERLLGMAPEERDTVVDWLKKNLPFPREKKDNGQSEKWEAYIGYAPADIVGEYAKGDVIRTRKLFDLLYPQIVKRTMLPAYNIERELMPILLENERKGIRIDLPLLRKDYKLYMKAMDTADAWLRKALKCPTLNVNSDEEIAECFSVSGWVDDDQWVITKGGKRSVSKKNLKPEMVNHKKGQQVFAYRNKLATCVADMRRMLSQAEKTGGTIHTTWNQVKGEFGGAGTGRLSSSPNFQNISTGLEEKGDGFIHPEFLNVPHLPEMRKYYLPDVGCVWIKRDYSQQELRILAHFEDGDLLRGYLANPKLDVHGIVDKALREMKLIYTRKQLKNGIVFPKIYGSGKTGIAESLNCDMATAGKIIDILLEALPGYDDLEKDVKATAKAGNPIATWGGREYYVKPAGYSVKYKRFMEYSYMLLNYLIQGSAADCTKLAIIMWHRDPRKKARFIVTVHDEINACALKAIASKQNDILNDNMLKPQFALPMLSEGEMGTNWAELKKAP
jgi:DNA polymerase I-like protein with 3'-5' exonuclease and polymerase domains